MPPTGTFVGTCPKVIAANCVPGVRYEKGPPVVCVGHGNPRLARTATPADLRRLKRESKAEAEHALAHPPTQLFLHILPNGKARGICVWGRSPANTAARIAGDF